MPRTVILTAHTVDYQAVRVHYASAFTFEILAKYKIGDAGATQRIRGIVSYGMTPDELLTGIGQRVEAAVSSESISLTDERHKRIDHARTLINQGQFNQAVQYLKALRTELQTVLKTSSGKLSTSSSTYFWSAAIARMQRTYFTR